MIFHEKYFFYKKYNIQAAFPHEIVRPREALYFAIDLNQT